MSDFFAMHKVVVPASNTIEFLRNERNGISGYPLFFSNLLGCFSFVVGWNGIKWFKLTSKVKNATISSSNFIKSRRIVAGEASVTFTSCSTVAIL